MKCISEQTKIAQACVVLALLLSLATPPNASAKEKRPQDVPASVIAHVALPANAGSQMLLQRRSGKQYLYIQQASKQGYMVVDVTKPTQPSLMDKIAPAAQNASGNLEMVGPDVAISESSDKKTPNVGSVVRPAETVRILDMSDPGNPKTLQTFAGVTGILSDSGRIYLTNTEGLWILRYSQYQKRPLPPCDSESVFSPIVDCQ